MGCHELKIYSNNAIGFSVNSWELAQCYMQKASNLTLQKFFQNKIVFIDTIGNPRACTKKSSCLIKGWLLLAQPCLHRAHLLLLYNVRVEIWWPGWHLEEMNLMFLSIQFLFLVLKSAAPTCKIPICVILRLHERVDSCSTGCSQEDFYWGNGKCCLLDTWSGNIPAGTVF